MHISINPFGLDYEYSDTPGSYWRVTREFQWGKSSPDQEIYEENLRRKQKEHLDRIRRQYEESRIPTRPWQPCAHDNCSQCCGTGIKSDGSMCAHMLSCSCPKCSPCFM